MHTARADNFVGRICPRNSALAISLYTLCKEVQQQTEATRARQATHRSQAQGTICRGYNLWVKPYQCSWHQS